MKEKSTILAQQEELKLGVAALSKARDEQNALATNRQEQIEVLKQERDSYANQVIEQQARIESLNQVNAALKNDKEAQIKETSTVMAQFWALKQEVVMLNRLHDEQSELANQLQAQIEALTQEHTSHVAEKQAHIDSLTQANAVLKTNNEALAQQNSAIVSQLEQLDKNQTENNELLLLQLHQAQLESEQSFRQQQEETLDRLQIAEARWQRLLQRNPAYLDYETIKILPALLGEDKAITWQLTNLFIAGHLLPTLEFRTPLEQGIAGIIFTRSSESISLFTRWPASARHHNELILMPVGERMSTEKFIETSFELTTSDWNLIQALTALLIEKLASPDFIKEYTDIQAEAFRSGLEKFMQILKKFPATVRYDQVQLKSVHTTLGYEHLWLHFDNFSFHGKGWPEFEFRIACADVQPNQFGAHPRLEFPEEGGQVPFNAWFVESYDDFGTKLELRFAQPDAMDMAIWWRLTEHDRTFLAALIKCLPFILDTVKNSDGKLQRPWAEWSKLATEIQRIFAMRTTVSLVPTPVPAVPMSVASIKSTAPSTSASSPEEPKQTQELLSVVKPSEKSSTQTALKTSAAKSASGTKRRRVQK
ncbi:hypothetical protein [Nitrosomonas sp. Nm34]|uniref:hypothetical protein n=1 Tax=Nitrosomonas sp. Nm34 TaxID=1881055 RepID=UPI0008E5288D|nr:hypothetical protein [Nitrosomonas sp. Nm34]SFI58257.1 hypothetical protein SAMN05428978_101829 [Nitrosomonas sp. Nm34]